MMQYTTEQTQFRDMVQRFDEVLLLKASKQAVDQVNGRFLEYCTVEDLSRARHSIEQTWSSVKGEVTRVENEIKQLDSRIGNEIKGTVRSAMLKMKSNITQFDATTFTQSQAELRSLISLKADK